MTSLSFTLFAALVRPERTGAVREETGSCLREKPSASRQHAKTAARGRLLSGRIP
jgi:hypothetical protein